MYGDTRLANLTVMVYPAGINGSTATANLTMENLGKLEELVETFLRAYSVTACNNDGSTLEVVLGSLYVVVEYLYYVCLGRNILRYLGINNLTLCLALVDGLLHNTRTNGSHLWTVVGIDNCGNDVTTEGRTNLIEQILVGLARLLVLVRANLKLCTVSGESAGER